MPAPLASSKTSNLMQGAGSPRSFRSVHVRSSLGSSFMCDGQHIRPEDPFPGVADKDHKLTGGNGVRVNTPRLLSGPFSQIVDVREGWIGQNHLLPESVLNDGLVVLEIVIRQENGGPGLVQGGQVRVSPLLRTRYECWPFAHRPTVADRLMAGKPQTTAVLDRMQLGKHDAADEFRVVEPVCPLDNREWFPGSRSAPN